MNKIFKSKLVVSFAIFLGLIFFNNCSKEEDSKAAQLYPKTYKKSQVPAIFEVYINGNVLNPIPFDRNYFKDFKDEIEYIDTGNRIFEITFESPNTFSSKNFIEGYYYFKNNILYLTDLKDTIAYANGSYDGFNVFLNQILLRKEYILDGVKVGGYSSTFFGPNEISLDTVLARCKLNSIKDIDENDTLAFHSINVFYK